LEFLDLIDTVASEMSSIPENITWRYHDILNNITIMYCDVIPLQHCKVLEFHPQQSGMSIFFYYTIHCNLILYFFYFIYILTAVLYNNIMYFTRKLAELSPTYKNLLIVHLLEKLKNLASEILHSQCKQQITQIEKIVNQSGKNYH